MADNRLIHGKLRLAGILVSLGLIVEVGTFYWSHPVTFVTFILLGGTLVTVGIGIYLLSLVSD